MHRYDLATGKLVGTMKVPKGAAKEPSASMTTTAASAMIAAVRDSAAVRILDAATGEKIIKVACRSRA